MGLFGKLFDKKLSAQEIYWKEHPDELREIEESGQSKLAALNELSAKIDTAATVAEIVSHKETALSILEWYAVLDDRECPYHLVGGAAAFKGGLLNRCNTAIVAAGKSSPTDFIAARDALCKAAANYDLSLSELAIQVRAGYFYGTAKSWIAKAKHLFETNRAAKLWDVYVECGMPEDIARSRDADLINSQLPFAKGSDEESVFKTYAYALRERYALRYLPLNEIDKAQYGLNIPAGETILHRINVVTLHEERVVRRDIAYSGVRWSNGLLRAGTISAIGNEIKDFAAQDIGRLFITDRRIIFVGAQRSVTKAIDIKDVLFYNLYRDGVLINRANKKAVLFRFDDAVDYEIYSVGDGMNEFTTVLGRVIAGTAKEDLLKDNSNV